MKFLPKTYKLKKNKTYIKTSNLFFFFNGTNIKSSDWISTEQKLKTFNFSYYKILNKTVSVEFKNSIYCNIKSSLIVSLIILIKPEVNNNKILNKKIILNKLNFLNFILLSINLNNQIYSVILLKEIISLSYVTNDLLLYKFISTSLKIFTKNRNNVI